MAKSTVLQDNILLTIRKMLGGNSDDYFDEDIAVHINAAFARLRQLGVGPADGFRIETGDETWGDFMTDGFNDSIKTYVFLKVKRVFDPPSSSFVLSAMDTSISELEWLLNVDSETE